MPQQVLPELRHCRVQRTLLLHRRCSRRHLLVRKGLPEVFVESWQRHAAVRRFMVGHFIFSAPALSLALAAAPRQSRSFSPASVRLFQNSLRFVATGALFRTLMLAGPARLDSTKAALFSPQPKKCAPVCVRLSVCVSTTAVCVDSALLRDHTRKQISFFVAELCPSHSADHNRFIQFNNYTAVCSEYDRSIHIQHLGHVVRRMCFMFCLLVRVALLIFFFFFR